jgi:magnesium transporter
MISLFCWSAGQKAGMWVNAELLRTHADQLRNSPDVFWIDLTDPTQEEEDLVLREFYPVHRLTFGDITRQRREGISEPHLPKVEEFPEYLFVVVNPLSRWLTERLKGTPKEKKEATDAAGGTAGSRNRALTQLSAVITRKLLITHHYEPINAVEELRGFLDKHEEQSERGPDYLFHIILDSMVDEFAPLLDRLHASLDRMEARIFRKPDQKLLVRLMRLKRHIFLLRKTLIYEREVVARLARGEFGLIDDREMVYYRNVYDHVVRFTELIEAARETATDLMQTHLSAASHKLNEVMKVLTMISTIVLPMTLVSGIYGMNFDQGVFPASTQDFTGFLMVLGIMVTLGVGALSFFRWRGWL